MSPCETSSDDAYLEYPGEAFDYYHSSDVTRVVCEEKHMGSRAIVIVCQDDKVARDRVVYMTAGDVNMLALGQNVVGPQFSKKYPDVALMTVHTGPGNA